MVNRYNKFYAYTRVNLDLLDSVQEPESLPEMKNLKQAVRSCITAITDELQPILNQAELNAVSTSACWSSVGKLCRCLLAQQEKLKQKAYTQPLSSHLQMISEFVQIFLIESKCTSDPEVDEQILFDCLTVVKEIGDRYKKELVTNLECNLDDLFVKSDNLKLINLVLSIIIDDARIREARKPTIRMDLKAMIHKCMALYQVACSFIQTLKEESPENQLDPCDHVIGLKQIVESRNIKQVVDWDLIKISEIIDQHGHLVVFKIRDWLSKNDVKASEVEYSQILDGHPEKNFLIGVIKEHVDEAKLNNIIRVKAGLCRRYEEQDKLAAELGELLPTLIEARCMLYYNRDQEAYKEFHVENWKLIDKFLRRSQTDQPLFKSALRASILQDHSDYRMRVIPKHPEFELINQGESEQLLHALKARIEVETDRVSKVHFICLAVNIIDSHLTSIKTRTDLIEEVKQGCIEQIYFLCQDWTTNDLTFEFERLIRWSYLECTHDEKKQNRNPTETLIEKLKYDQVIDEVLKQECQTIFHHHLDQLCRQSQSNEQTEFLKSLNLQLADKYLSSPVSTDWACLIFIQGFMISHISQHNLEDPELTANILNRLLDFEIFATLKPSVVAKVKNIIFQFREDAIQAAAPKITATGPFTVEFMQKMLSGDTATLAQGIKWMHFAAKKLENYSYIRKHLKNFTLAVDNDSNFAAKANFIVILDRVASTEQITKKDKSKMIHVALNLVDQDCRDEEFSTLQELILKRLESLAIQMKQLLSQSDGDKSQQASTSSKLEFYLKLTIVRMDRLQKVLSISLEPFVSLLLKAIDSQFESLKQKKVEQPSLDLNEQQKEAKLSQSNLTGIISNLSQLVVELKDQQIKFAKRKDDDQKHQEDRDRIQCSLFDMNSLVFEAVRNQMAKVVGNQFDILEFQHCMQLIQFMLDFDLIKRNNGRLLIYHDFVQCELITTMKSLTLAYFTHFNMSPTADQDNTASLASKVVVDLFTQLVLFPDQANQSQRLEQVVVEKAKYRNFNEFQIHLVQQNLDAIGDVEKMLAVGPQTFQKVLRLHFQRVANGFASFGLRNGANTALKEVKFHNNEENIMSIVMMGLADRKNARKALKLSGNLQNAITFILESGEAGLNEVEVSDEEEKPEKQIEGKTDELVKTISVEDLNERIKGMQGLLLRQLCTFVKEHPSKDRATDLKEYSLELLRAWKPANENQPDEQIKYYLGQITGVLSHLTSALQSLDQSADLFNILEATSIVIDTSFELLYTQTYSEQQNQAVQDQRTEIQKVVQRILNKWLQDSGDDSMASKFCQKEIEAKNDHSFKLLTSYISLLHQLLNYGLFFQEPRKILKKSRWLKLMRGEPVEAEDDKQDLKQNLDEWMKPIFSLSQFLLPVVPESEICLLIVCKNLSQISMRHLFRSQPTSTLTSEFRSYLSLLAASSPELTLLYSQLSSPPALQRSVLRSLIVQILKVKQFKHSKFSLLDRDYEPNQYKENLGDLYKVELKELVGKVLREVMEVKEVWRKGVVEMVVEVIRDVCEVEVGQNGGIFVWIKQQITDQEVELPIVQFEVLIEESKKLLEVKEHVDKDGKLPSMPQVEKLTSHITEFIENSRHFDYLHPSNRQDYERVVIDLADLLVDEVLPKLLLQTNNKDAFIYGSENLEVSKAINLLTGCGYYAHDEARKFKEDLRLRITKKAVYQIERVQTTNLSDMSLEDLKSVRSALCLLISLSNQMNIYEFNRLLLSADCYFKVITYLLDSNILSKVEHLQSKFSEVRLSRWQAIIRDCLSKCVELQQIVYRHLIGVTNRQNQMEIDEQRKLKVNGKPESNDNESKDQEQTVLDQVLNSSGQSCKQCLDQHQIYNSTQSDAAEILNNLDVLQSDLLLNIEQSQQNPVDKTFSSMFPKKRPPHMRCFNYQQLLTNFQSYEEMRPLRDSHTSVLKAWIHAESEANKLRAVDVSKVVTKVVSLLEDEIKPKEEAKEVEEIKVGGLVIEEVKAKEESKAEEEMYGYPVSFLRESEVDPEMLEFLPEEMRIEILSGLDASFKDWKAKQQKDEPEVQASSLIEPDLAEEPSAELDAQTREIIELGLDPEFLQSLPPDMRQELINNARQEMRQPEVSMPAEMDIATLIEIQSDPQIRREMLQNLSQDQINDLPPSLRTEALNFLRGHHIERDEESEEVAQEERQRQNQRHVGGLGMHKKVIANPDTLNLSELLFTFSLELDQQNFDQLCRTRQLGQITLNDNTQLLQTTLLNSSGISCDLIDLFKSKALYFKIKNPGLPCSYLQSLLSCLSDLLSISIQQDHSSLLSLCKVTQISLPSIFLTSKHFNLLVSTSLDFSMHLLIRYRLAIEEFLLLNTEEEKSFLERAIGLMNGVMEKEEQMKEAKVNQEDDRMQMVSNTKAKLEQFVKVVLHCFNHQFESGSPNWKQLNQNISRQRLESLFHKLAQLIQVRGLDVKDEFAAIAANISSNDRANWQMMMKSIGNQLEHHLASLNDYALQVLMRLTEQGLTLTEAAEADNTKVELKEQTVTEIRNELQQMFPITKPFLETLALLKSLITKVSKSALSTFKSILELASKNEHEQVAALQQQLDFQDTLLRDVFTVFSQPGFEIFVSQLSQMLEVQRAQSVFTDEQSNTLILLVFECFMAELEIEVINAKDREQVRRNNDKSLDSKYVEMHRVRATPKEIKAEVSQLVVRKEISTHLSRQQSSKVFGDFDGCSDSRRLADLAVFCEQNKSLLNRFIKELVEANRGLYVHVGSEQVIRKYIWHMPSLLDFEVKQALFRDELQQMRQKQRRLHRLNISVRRNQIFQDSYAQISHLRAGDMMGGTNVEFSGEGGYDAGGLTRDFFTELSKQLFNQNYSLFRKSDNGSTYMPNSKSYVQAEHIGYFKFVGKIIAKAILDNCLLECFFVKSIYKNIVGQKLRFRDLEDFDHALYVGLDWMLNAKDPENVEALYETFCIEEDYFGKPQVIDLIPDGRNIDVTYETRELYVEKKAYYTLYKTVQRQLDSFLEGFYEIIPFKVISLFSYKELELVISGLPDFNLEDLKKSTTYYGYTEESPQIVWFWEFMATLDRTEKCNFLQFLTGSSKVPVDGFKNLQGMSGPTPPRIIKSRGESRLPEAHTCFNQLDLPEYGSKEELMSKMRWAITESSGFGFG